VAGGGLKRAWQVAVDSERPEHWTPDSGEPIAVVPVDDEDALLTELVNAAWVLKRFGGGVGMIAVREELAPGIFETTDIALQWESYAPTKRLPREQREPAPQPERAPAPVEATPPAVAPEPTPAPVVAVEPEPVLEEEDDFDAPLPTPGDDGFGDGEIIDETRIDASKHAEPSPTELGIFDTAVPVQA
jgi:hypothetical protein